MNFPWFLRPRPHQPDASPSATVGWSLTVCDLRCLSVSHTTDVHQLLGHFLAFWLTLYINQWRGQPVRDFTLTGCYQTVFHACQKPILYIRPFRDSVAKVNNEYWFRLEVFMKFNNVFLCDEGCSQMFQVDWSDLDDLAELILLYRLSYLLIDHPSHCSDEISPDLFSLCFHNV